MRELTVALVVAALSGIAFLAYSRPKIFSEKLFWPMYWLWTGLYFALIIWHISADFTLMALRQFIHPEEYDQAKAALEENVYPVRFWWMVGGYLAGWLFLGFLHSLSKWLQEEGDEKKRD
jgi:hypothetical protein